MAWFKSIILTILLIVFFAVLPVSKEFDYKYSTFVSADKVYEYFSNPCILVKLNPNFKLKFLLEAQDDYCRNYSLHSQNTKQEEPVLYWDFGYPLNKGELVINKEINNQLIKYHFIRYGFGEGKLRFSIQEYRHFTQINIKFKVVINKYLPWYIVPLRVFLILYIDSTVRKTIENFVTDQLLNAEDMP